MMFKLIILFKSLMQIYIYIYIYIYIWHIYIYIYIYILLIVDIMKGTLHMVSERFNTGTVDHHTFPCIKFFINNLLLIKIEICPCR
jgi:hypothetical protein